MLGNSGLIFSFFSPPRHAGFTSQNVHRFLIPYLTDTFRFIRSPQDGSVSEHGGEGVAAEEQGDRQGDAPGTHGPIQSRQTPFAR